MQDPGGDAGAADAATDAPLRPDFAGAAAAHHFRRRRCSAPPWREILARLGPILFNLYGTSEAGFCVMAEPDVLARKPESIGKPVWGVRASIVDESGREAAAGAVGRLRIRSAWAASRNSWTETGDLARRDPEGDIFLGGRADDMIVSGGENVYPVELENVLVQHPDLEAAAVVGIPDEEFGQRLKAVVVTKRAQRSTRRRCGTG